MLAPLAVPAQLLFAAIAAAFAPRRVAAVPILAFLAVPWLVGPGQTTLAATTALLSVVLFMRAAELWRERPARPALDRLVHALSIPDLRLARRVSPRIDVRLAATGTLALFTGVGITAAAVSVVRPAYPATPALTWVVGVVGFYLFFEGVDRSARTLYLLTGLEVEPTQRAPIRSRTISEFWGQRWNTIVRRWLAAMAFSPLARRWPRLGTFLAFVLSAAIHGWIMLPSLGWGAAARMGGFFLVHGALVLTERALRVARWPGPWPRIWTIGWFAATAPLFMDPLLRLL